LYSFKEDFVQGVFLGVEESCTRRVLFGVKRSCAHLAKGVCQVVYKALVVGVHKSRKENLKHFAWGLDVGHKDRTRITLVCLRLYFLCLSCDYFNSCK